MASTAWMKNKDDRAAALEEYRRLRTLTAREVAEVMQNAIRAKNKKQEIEEEARQKVIAAVECEVSDSEGIKNESDFG